ncbi:hypothetical protein E2C01_045459 [Portunus trituberculatus]|uniref:Uncharacterized protein n=1 Tax=Portunus trituberculatus TaxID=210409 RepID=A0A5B7FV20_PORTR|nr:hypothetical protein [Portunus trituberculatus]
MSKSYKLQLPSRFLASDNGQAVAGGRSAAAIRRHL